MLVAQLFYFYTHRPRPTSWPGDRLSALQIRPSGGDMGSVAGAPWLHGWWPFGGSFLRLLLCACHIGVGMAKVAQRVGGCGLSLEHHFPLSKSGPAGAVLSLGKSCYHWPQPSTSDLVSDRRPVHPVLYTCYSPYRGGREAVSLGTATLPISVR